MNFPADNEDIDNFNIIFSAIYLIDDNHVMDDTLLITDPHDDGDYQLFLPRKVINNVKCICDKLYSKGTIKYFLEKEEVLNILLDKIYLFVKAGNEPNKRNYTKLKNSIMREMKINKTIIYPINSICLNKVISVGDYKIFPNHELRNVFHDKENDEYIKDIINNSKFDCNSYVSISVSAFNKMHEVKSKNALNFFLGTINLLMVLYEDLDCRMYTQEKWIKPTQKYKLIHDGTMGYTVEYDFKGRIVNDDFWNKIDCMFRGDSEIKFEEIMNMSSRPEDFRENILIDRLIDSITYFFDALHDDNKRSQIVKLTIAIERLIIFPSDKGSDKVAFSFTNRSMKLIKDVNPDVSDIMTTISKKIYNLRSDIVHGNICSYKDFNLELDVNPIQFTAICIHSAMVVFSKIGYDNISEREILKYFQ